MKINLNDIDRNQFMVHDHILNGEVIHLVQPQHIGCSFTQENKHLRSSVWDSQGNLVSAGFPKFVNWGEKPEQFPVPSSLNGCVVMEKLDGSLLIVSRFNGQYILRTRGTVDARKLDNGYELDAFQPILDRLIRNFESKGETWDFSLLFEWLSPTNVIVINYGDKPQFRLIGQVNHADYSLVSQKSLDFLADVIGVDRPETFSFGSIEDLLAQVDNWKGREGVCIYSKNGQEIHKCKALSYLIKHRFKENATLENTLELFVAFGYPSYQSFEQQLIQQFDYECFSMVRGFASQVVDAFKQVREIESGMVQFVNDLREMSRKDAAIKITSSYGSTNRASFCFDLLDNKTLGPKEYTKLLWQVLKK